ncbi:MAG: hypothetical protein AB1761_07455 [Pseudomonadota bacterium]
MSQIVEQRIAMRLGNFAATPPLAPTAPTGTPLDVPYADFLARTLIGDATAIAPAFTP